MPGNYESDEGTSPSVLAELYKYRFQRSPRTTYKPLILDSPTVSSTSGLERNNRKSLDSPTRDIVIPETPEFVSSPERVSSAPSSDRITARESSSSPGPRMSGIKVIGANCPVVVENSSSSQTMDVLVQEDEDSAMDEYEIFCEKEQCLKEFLKHLPHADIMEAQDLLARCKWNLTEALDAAKTHPISKKKTVVAAVPKGVVFKKKKKSKYTIDSDSDEDVVDLDADDEDLDDNVNYITQNGSNSSPGRTYPSKRRRVFRVEDSDDDTQTSQPNELQSETQKPKSNFSVLDYDPQNSDILLRQSRESPPRTSAVSSYSKANPCQMVQRTINNSIFSNDEPHYATKVKPTRNTTPRKKRKKYESDEDDDDDYGNDNVYDSEDSDGDGGLTPARNSVLTFFRDATLEELLGIPGCSKKKAEAVIKYRPFSSWADLVQKLSFDKTLSGEMLNGAKKVLDMRLAISRLMNKCQKIALQMEDLVEALKENKEDNKDYVSSQPAFLNDSMHLTPYQMLGLNWLLLMHNQDVNAILADEMGLGKTIQAIAFLAYLQEQEIPGPHLIVVPSSTLDNWQNELRIWWPGCTVLRYHGSQDSRRELRLQIINDEIDEFDVMVTTYSMVASSAEDRNFFKKLEFHYVIFDEAHMLKNMASQRYQNLMKVKAGRRLLLTGTPLQNNLIELMSLLIFAMPDMFSGKTEQVKQMFSAVCKSDEGKSQFERERIEHAKRIMKPFVLRRLKTEVLKDLPAKHEKIRMCKMSDKQVDLYNNLVVILSEEVSNVKKGQDRSLLTSGASMMMQLRRAANHPLLLRSYYDEEKLEKLSQLMLNEPTNKETNVDYIFEDMLAMSDFDIHSQCMKYASMKSFALDNDKILDSGKFAILDELLPQLIEEGHRILLFSQFTMVLDIVGEYMRIRNYKFLRLDGQIPTTERQLLIDEYNQNEDIPVFLLSTRAGGLGINLTAADTVLIHDIDFNPYNDKQAEDRSHRVGQSREVTVIRMISENTIEEGILQRANEKLKLEQDITAINEDEEKDKASVATLLRDALKISSAKS